MKDEKTPVISLENLDCIIYSEEYKEQILNRAIDKYCEDDSICTIMNLCSNMVSTINSMRRDGMIGSYECENAEKMVRAIRDSILLESEGYHFTTISDDNLPTIGMYSPKVCGGFSSDQFFNDGSTYVFENDDVMVRIHKARARGSDTPSLNKWASINVYDKHENKVVQFSPDTMFVERDPDFYDGRLSYEQNEKALAMFRSLYVCDGNGGISDRGARALRRNEETYRNFVTLYLQDIAENQAESEIGNVEVGPTRAYPVPDDSEKTGVIVHESTGIKVYEE